MYKDIRYLNTLDNTIELPKEESWILSIQWSNADTTSTTYTVYLNEWGTFNTTIEIPLDSSFGPKTLFAFSENYTYSTSVEILIAEPRIPTALLKMSTTDKIKIPGRALPIQIELDTYTGQGIEGAPISITWTLTRSTPSYFLEGYFYGIRGILPPSSTTSETGNMMVYTGINGKIEFNLTLQLNNMEEEGNTLTILAEYFSLTKELLTQTINLEVAYTQLALSLTTTVEEGLIIIPGYDFGVLGLVQDITNGNTVENISVEITLYKGEGTLASYPTTGELELTNLTAIKTCTFISSKKSEKIDCIFLLPEIGKFLLVGRIKNEEKYRVISVIPLGRTEEEWRNDPLKNWNGISMVLDKSSYEVGETVYINFFNPFSESMVLILWGNSQNQRAKIFQNLEYEETNISQVIGWECTQSCPLNFILVSPRSKNVTLPVNIPTSVLFDINSPASITKSFTININNNMNPKYLDVTITKEKDVVAPGNRTSFTISLSKQGIPTSGEVAVFVVDKAVLDLKPIPDNFFNETLSQSSSILYDNDYSIFDSRVTLVTKEDYLRVRDIVERRFKPLGNRFMAPSNYPLLYFGC